MLCQFFYPDKVSSAVLPFELAEHLAINHNITVVCGMPRESDVKKNVKKKEIIKNIKIKRCNYIQFDKDKFIGRILNYFSFVVAVLLKLKNFWKKDVCIVYSNPPLLALLPSILKKICGFKLIYVVYDVYPDVAINFNKIREKSIIAKMFNRINRFVFKHCDKIVVLSSEMKEYFVNNKNVEEGKIEIIANWYELKKEYKPYKPNNSKIKILYGGNMGVCQDMDTLLVAAKKLKDNNKIEFIFAGTGSKVSYIKKYISDNEMSNCIFYDFLPKEKYEFLMDTADLYVVSLENEARGLGSPSKVYCYYAMGRPVLAIMPEYTDVVNDVNEYDCGYVIKPKDVESLIKVLVNINKQMLVKKGCNARSIYLDKYTAIINVKKYEQFIQED